jgi:hypothetical protein
MKCSYIIISSFFEMSDLNKRITELEEEIKLYVAEYKNASGADKSELRRLIKVRSENLNLLYKREKGQEGKIIVIVNLYKYIMYFLHMLIVYKKR